MKAAVLRDLSQPMAIEEAEIAKPQGRDPGSMMGSMRPAVEIPALVDFYMQDRPKLDELISKRRPLSEVNEGFADLRQGELARSVILFDN